MTQRFSFYTIRILPISPILNVLIITLSYILPLCENNVPCTLRLFIVNELPCRIYFIFLYNII